MDLQEYLVLQFMSWQPLAPAVVARGTGDILLEWPQDRFHFLQDHLLYRLEKNNKLPKWIVVYSGGKTAKRIYDLAPSHPHRFRLTVILKADAVPLLAAKALEYYGDEHTVYQQLDETTDDDKKTGEGMGDANVEIVITVEDNSADEQCVKESTEGEEKNTVSVNNGHGRYTRVNPDQKWLQSMVSGETWTSTGTEGTSAACFCMAVRFGDHKEIQAMLEERPELIGVVNPSSGLTPLATAVRKGDVETCRLLVSQGAELDQPSGPGQTPLHLAALAAHLEIIDLLLDSGADLQSRDWNGLRVEHYAADSGRGDALRRVLERGGDVTVRDYNGWTPLFRAVCQGASAALVAELVSRGSDVGAVDRAGLPLTTAARLLTRTHGRRRRESILRLVDPSYPQQAALGHFTRLTKKIHHVRALLRFAPRPLSPAAPRWTDDGTPPSRGHDEAC